MKVDMVEKSELGRELIFSIEKEKVEEEKKGIVKEIKKDAVIEGFRKGKAPDNLVEKKYSSLIQERLLKKLITEAYFQVIKEKSLTPIVSPDVYDVNFDDGELKFKIYIELKPEVKLKKYKDIPVKKVKPESVSEKKIDEVLKEWEKKPEFAASIIDPEKRRAWREKIRAQLEYYSKVKAQVEEEKQLWEGIFKGVNFPLPEKLVNERAKRYTEEQLQRMNLQGKTKEEIEKVVQEIFDRVKPIAKEDLKKYFILDKIAEIEKIEVNEEEINQRIESISRTVGQPFESVKERLEKDGGIEDLKEEIRIDKAFKFLKDKANFIERIILPGEDKKGIKE